MTAAVATTVTRPGRTVGEGAAASHWLAPLVAGPRGAVTVVAATGAAAYLRDAGVTVVALELAGAGAGLPNAIAVSGDGPGLSGLAVGAVGLLGDGVLRVGRRTIRVVRWWDPRPCAGTFTADQLLGRRAELPSHEPPSGFGLAAAVGALRSAVVRADTTALPRVATRLVGRGPGSTPSGDDVLAGLLATLRCLGGTDPHARRVADALSATVADLSHRTGELSATLLRCADDGAVVRPARRVLEALVNGAPLAGPVADLCRLGHTSGHDLLTGIIIGVDLLITGRSPT